MIINAMNWVYKKWKQIWSLNHNSQEITIYSTNILDEVSLYINFQERTCHNVYSDSSAILILYVLLKK